jgi:hypothetical protein
VTITRLPKLKADISDKIVIAAGELRAEPEPLTAARERARLIASAADEGAVEVSPIVTRTISALRKAKPGPTGLVSSEGRLIHCEIAPASIDRVELALGRIMAAAAQQGFSLKAGEKGVSFAGADEEIGFSITETVRRTKHELTEKERAEQEKYERKREREIRSGGWSGSWFDRPQFPEWDYHPTGQLSFEFKHYYVAGAPRRTFRDGKVQRVEDMAIDIAVGIAVLAAAKTTDRLEREERQRQEVEQRRHREQAARAKHIEDRRTAELDQIIGEAQRIDQLTTFLDQIRSNTGGGERVAELRSWVEGSLEISRERLRGDALEARFAALRLFGDDDDHDYRSPHYW